MYSLFNKMNLCFLNSSHMDVVSSCSIPQTVEMEKEYENVLSIIENNNIMI